MLFLLSYYCRSTRDNENGVALINIQMLKIYVDSILMDDISSYNIDLIEKIEEEKLAGTILSYFLFFLLIF